ncbi:levansucrase [Streptomyces sp. UNOC14_S4]|uniref:levansucrase n=1 Tax=Streptomyces sp. UNOC14_S4 TaxID=2872340 RepID=UPI001E43E09A|nr:levansucrase [Streptomyces sp. UNOC14_S4]MCC3767362.1 levansucrase [Streptomyces sp. UNOC14_S4]
MIENSVQGYMASLEQQLTADGCATHWEDWSSMAVLVGRRADFRVRWMATRVHLFTVAAAMPEITRPDIERFTRRVLTYAKANKGGLPLGSQTGVIVFPVLVGERVDPEAVAWAEEKQRGEFACMARPVVVGVARQRVGFYSGNPFFGRVYASYVNEKGARYFLGEGAS